MAKILRPLLLLVAIYFAYTELFPWLKDLSKPDRPSADAAPSARCFFRTEEAQDLFAEGFRRFSAPPVDLDHWQDHYENVSHALSVADAACNCDEEACGRATSALGQLRRLMDDTHDSMSRNLGFPSDSVGRMDEFQRAFNQAKTLAR